AAARESRGARAGRAYVACPRRARRRPRPVLGGREASRPRGSRSALRRPRAALAARLERVHPGPDHARLDAELGLDDPYVVTRWLEPFDRDDLARRAQEQLT